MTSLKKGVHVPNPAFMYCVNTTIEEESDDAKVVFFNEALEQMLEKSWGGGGEQSWGTTRPSNPDPKTTTKRRRPDSPVKQRESKQGSKRIMRKVTFLTSQKNPNPC
ncbi:hypothetical protein HanXRQr2_Chr17g0806511 [Helianthus annuus]|uniref:Uncharacterized protein n=1 Tax=Helianthus annuus TaxID=4232 RepID=A0A9K3DKD2_HELAN|nr:hypothetical protein HanXRQr2_Chr17g0806511 [Helianthus annuus]